MSFYDNPRGFLTEALFHTLMGGFKTLRYAFSARYRKRVREHWQRYPALRWRGITRMILGSLLLVLVLLVGIVVALP